MSIALKMPSKWLSRKKENKLNDQSFCFICVFIDVSVFPQISSLSHCLCHIYLNGLVAIDIHLNCWGRYILQIFQYLCQSLVQIVFRILVLHIRHWHVDLILRSKVDFVIVVWNLIWNFHTCDNWSLVSPTSRYVSQCIASSTDQ